MGQMPAQSPLTSSGSGRIWVSDAGMRVESQGAGGDQVAGVSKATRTAWTYDYAANTVRRWVMMGDGRRERAHAVAFGVDDDAGGHRHVPAAAGALRRRSTWPAKAPSPAARCTCCA